MEEDFIDAANPREAVEKYGSNFLYVADEMGRSDAGYAAAVAVQAFGKTLLGQKRGN